MGLKNPSINPYFLNHLSAAASRSADHESKVELSHVMPSTATLRFRSHEVCHDSTAAPSFPALPAAPAPPPPPTCPRRIDHTRIRAKTGACAVEYSLSSSSPGSESSSMLQLTCSGRVLFVASSSSNSLRSKLWPFSASMGPTMRSCVMAQSKY